MLKKMIKGYLKSVVIGRLGCIFILGRLLKLLILNILYQHKDMVRN